VLAAGRGARLGDGGRASPKALLQVGDEQRPRWTLSLFAKAGVSPVTVVVGHRAREIERAVADWAMPGAVRCVMNHAFAATDTAASFAAGAEIGRGPAVVTYAHTMVAPGSRAAARRAGRQVRRRRPGARPSRTCASASTTAASLGSPRISPLRRRTPSRPASSFCPARHAFASSAHAVCVHALAMLNAGRPPGAPHHRRRILALSGLTRLRGGTRSAPAPRWQRR
jgi:MobA-like NTP transferase protein